MAEADDELVCPDLIAAPEDPAGDLAVGARIHLVAASCPQCGHLEFPTLDTCPACGRATEEIALSVDAELAGFTSVLHPPPGALVEVPYHVGVARFPEGICVMGLLLGVEDGETPTVGEPLDTVVARPFDGALTYAFRL